MHSQRANYHIYSKIFLENQNKLENSFCHNYVLKPKRLKGAQTLGLETNQSTIGKVSREALNSFVGVQFVFFKFESFVFNWPSSKRSIVKL